MNNNIYDTERSIRDKENQFRELEKEEFIGLLWNGVVFNKETFVTLQLKFNKIADITYLEILNMKAAGVGLTLTAGEAVIMNDLSFVPAEHSQAEDRAYRYGQKNSVSVYYPLFENTIEGVIYDILIKKKQIIGTVMGDVDENSVDIVEQILNEINSK